MIKKRLAILFLLSSCIIIMSVACAKKSLPVISSRITKPIKMKEEPANVTPDFATGKVIFENRCKNCHDLPKPDQFTKERWEGILSYMMPRARLNNEQSVHVSAYLKQNAAK